MNIDTIANQIQGTQFQKDLTTEMLINGKRSTRAYYNLVVGGLKMSSGTLG
jgi:hypothetical protein